MLLLISSKTEIESLEKLFSVCAVFFQWKQATSQTYRGTNKMKMVTKTHH